MTGVAVVSEYRGHALGSADVADGRGVSSYVIEGVLHRELRISFENLWLGAAVIPHEVRTNELGVEPLESASRIEYHKSYVYLINVYKSR